MDARYLRIPEYSLEAPIDRACAREDRILINIGNWLMEGTTSQFSEIVGNLHNIDHNFNWIDTGPIFQTGRSTRQRATWQVLGGNEDFIRPVGAPLFAGKLIGQYAGRSTQAGDGVSRWKFWAELSLNPTRAALHQDDHAEWFDPDITPFKVRTTHNDHFDNWEPRLVPSDNVLVGGSHKHANYVGERWVEHSVSYFETVCEVFRSILHEAHESAGMERFAVEPWMEIREIENYFEFFSREPVNEVMALENLMRRLGGNPAVTWADPTQHGFELIGHSPCVRMNLSSDATLKVYAKTSRRLRFEVTKKRRSLTAAIGGSRQLHNHSEYRTWLNRTADAAHADLTRLFQRLSEFIRPIENRRSPEELITKVYASCPDQLQYAEVLLRQLAYFGHIARWRHFPAQNAVRTLRRWRVLDEQREVERVRVYPLAREYIDAADALREVFQPPEADQA